MPVPTLSDSQHKLLLKIAEDPDEFAAIGDSREAEAIQAAALARIGFVQLDSVPTQNGVTLRAKITIQGRAYVRMKAAIGS